ncbi:MAG TPA: UDP-N-acetylmuramoyl-L-alanyl-D-glutamate--2,6-diaminopimelate ligase [Solirubrobacterales bacterium]|nr:UDP-N-acetylmuramoyl-L-alanyl-D-glutamate--2,6-diaminopimelate ligase [Solirubrobacterales bacterium]
MRLRELLADTEVAEIVGDAGAEIGGLAYDSRTVEPGTLFFCVPGQRSDGHEFGKPAVDRGAVALVVERLLDVEATQVRVPDSRAAMAPIAVRYWADPTAKLQVAGITGTNGKTTTAFLVRHVLSSRGTSTGLLGTVKRIVGGVEEEVERTTPEAIDLQRTFRRMLDGGDAACAMEVSSHALALHRTAGVRFAVAVFTNLTQDHLDFHLDMEQYFLAKRELFSSPERESPQAAVLNVDDAYGKRLAAELEELGEPPLLTFSAGGAEGADFRAGKVSFDAAGSQFLCLGPDGEAQVRMPLPGHFNVENALAAIGACHALGVPTEEAAASLATADRVPGRFEPVDEGQPFTVLIDYAHTPDSLENVLVAARELTEERLIAVFGCGGDRDREKRPQMGNIAARLSDACVVTSDNPRSEEPGAIIGEILAGVPDSDQGEIEVEPDRRAAIALAFGAAAPGDTVVIAGKGHEQGQELAGGRKIPFDDREVAREELRKLAARAA